MKRIFYIVSILFWSVPVLSQHKLTVRETLGNSQFSIDSTQKQSARELYRKGLKYKNGDDTPIDYRQAFKYFEQAADLDDEQSIYAVGYMLYKGFGCQQDYQQAVFNFARGARIGRDNSMYFYGLCFRNGYGVERNEDSAKYWLNRAASLGYAQAKQELEQKAGENANDSATTLIKRIKNAAIPDNVKLNEFRSVTPHIPSSVLVKGDYSGFLLSYDWSGKYIISNRAINISLGDSSDSINANTSLIGKWSEKGAMPITLSASLKDDSLIFHNTQYRIKDHYSDQRAIAYDFRSANLNVVQSGDSVYLAGSLSMFSPERNEPSKPLFIALVRKSAIASSLKDSLLFHNLKKTAKDSSENKIASLKNIKVYPNPFASSVTVEFTVINKSAVSIQLINMGGALVYMKPKENLQPGGYAITLSPGRISSGLYILRLFTDNQVVDLKVIRK